MKDFKDEIAEKFIQAMEEGTAPWQKAWSGSQYTLKNGVTGHEYRGLNVLRLCLNTYEDPRYCTFNQAKDKGWKIKKGSHGYLIRHVCFIEKTDENGEILEGEKPIFCEKFFRVFNFEQIEGTPKFEEKEEDLKEFEIIPACENVLKNAEISIKEDKRSNQAFYDVRRDSITVPNRERFVDELSNSDSKSEQTFAKISLSSSRISRVKTFPRYLVTKTKWACILKTQCLPCLTSLTFSIDQV